MNTKWHKINEIFFLYRRLCMVNKFVDALNEVRVFDGSQYTFNDTCAFAFLEDDDKNLYLRVALNFEQHWMLIEHSSCVANILRCCRGNRDELVELVNTEIATIRARLKLLLKQYGQIKHHSNGIILVSKGKNFSMNSSRIRRYNFGFLHEWIKFCEENANEYR